MRVYRQCLDTQIIRIVRKERIELKDQCEEWR